MITIAPLPTINTLVSSLRNIIDTLSKQDASDMDLTIYHHGCYLVSSFCHLHLVDELRYCFVTLGLRSLPHIAATQHLSVLQDLFSLATPPQGSRMVIPIAGYIIDLLHNFSLPLSVRSDAISLLTNFLAAFSTSPSFVDFATPISIHLDKVIELVNQNPDYNPNHFLVDLEKLSDALQLSLSLISSQLSDAPTTLDISTAILWEETLRRKGETPLEMLASGEGDVAMKGLRALKKSKRKEHERKLAEKRFMKEQEAKIPKVATVNASNSGWD
ncbi:hypothetical protein P9112_003959 [Eukaryota sp. TZLM1-RC]